MQWRLLKSWSRGSGSAEISGSLTTGDHGQLTLLRKAAGSIHFASKVSFADRRLLRR
ncbi:MAG: hypothetical protein R3Y53_09165 [Bacillota bacterium]